MKIKDVVIFVSLPEYTSAACKGGYFTLVDTSQKNKSQ